MNFDIYLVCLRIPNNGPMWYRSYQKRNRPVEDSMLWHSDIKKASSWANKSVAKQVVKRLYKESPYYTSKNVKICRFTAIYQSEESN